MANEKGPEKDYRKVDQPKADSVLSNPNNLEEALDDLGAYEDFSNTDELFNSDKMDRLEVVKHKPFEDADKAKKVTKKASEDESMKEFSIKDEKDKPMSEDELEEILKDSDAYAKYLGLTDDIEVKKDK